MQTPLPKIVYYQDENLVFEYQVEESTGFVFMHCTCNNWSVSVARNLYSILRSFIEGVNKTSGVKKILALSPNPKFCHMYGGKTISTIEYDGKKYEVVVWELKQ